MTGNGYAVGTLCAMDTAPHMLDAEQREALTALAPQLVARLDPRRLLSASRAEALTDPLTGLGDRRRLMTDFEKAVGAASASAPMHLLLFDLNSFKLYNDTFGHNAGDQLLVRLSQRTRGGFGSTRAGSIGSAETSYCALVKCQQTRNWRRCAPRLAKR